MNPPHKTSGRLFADPEPPASGATFTANIDGAARGNPGPASYGVVVRGPDGAMLESLGKYIGRQTNNVAEYYALIAALDYAAAQGIKRLRVYSDSQLIVNQIKGVYKVKHADLRPLHERAKRQAAALESFTIQYVPREQNRQADAAANAALDKTGSTPRAPAAATANTATAETSQAGSRVSPPLTEPRLNVSRNAAAAEVDAGAPRTAGSRRSLTARKIRARFRDGVLVPDEPLGYAENEELELTIERLPRR